MYQCPVCAEPLDIWPSGSECSNVKCSYHGHEGEDDEDEDYDEDEDEDDICDVCGESQHGECECTDEELGC